MAGPDTGACKAKYFDPTGWTPPDLPSTWLRIDKLRDRNRSPAEIPDSFNQSRVPIRATAIARRDRTGHTYQFQLPPLSSEVQRPLCYVNQGKG